jgi:thiosulfate/3-mercaptopyruvate sulfurtransferase
MTVEIISSQWLANNLLDPKIKIIEVSAKKEGEAGYFEQHIPGAINFWWKDLCWDDTDRQFVTPEQLADRLGKVGISHKDTVVLYGEPVQYGTYALWSIIMAGHPDIKLLDGGRTRWISEGLPSSNTLPEIIETNYEIQEPAQEMRLGRDDVRENLKNTKRFLLDVRTPEEYSGERVMEYGQFDHGAERGGRIPGAKHLFFKELINNDDTFKEADEIREKVHSVGANAQEFDEIVIYCRLSHRATLVWTAMTYILGYSNVKIYDGSWTEWGSIVGFPVEK